MKRKISSGFYHRLQVDFSCKSNHIEGSCHNFNNTVKGGSNMTYELRHFDTPLMRFTATEDTSSPEIEIPAQQKRFWTAGTRSDFADCLISVSSVIQDTISTANV